MFKNDRNELNQSKLPVAYNGQNQSRMVEKAQNGHEWVKTIKKWVKRAKAVSTDYYWSKTGTNVRNELNRSKMASIGPN